MAAAAVVTGASFLVAPTLTASAVALAAGDLAYVWSVLYAAGGLVVLAGMCRNSPRLEGAGMALLAGGIAVATVATGYLRGWQWATATSVLVQGGAAAAALVRVYVLWVVAKR